jgi:type IV secretion system protein VirD4
MPIAEPKLQKRKAWLTAGVALVIITFCVSACLLWPLAQLLQPLVYDHARGAWAAAPWPPGLSRYWVDDSSRYFGDIAAGYLKPWWQIVKLRFWSIPQQRGELPIWFVGAGTVAGMIGTAWLAACPWDSRPESHGSSRWATMVDLHRDGLLAPTGFILGQLPLLRDSTARSGGLLDWLRIWSIKHFGMKLARVAQTLSGVLLAPPGTGKTVQLIGLLLSDWPDTVRSWWGGSKPAPFPGPSFVINDPKGEIFRATAAWRATLGPVFRLAWSESTGHRWNPIGWGALPMGERLPRLWRELFDRARAVYGEDAPDALRSILSLIREHENWQDLLLADPSLPVAGNAEAARHAKERGTPDRLKAIFALVYEQHGLWANLEQYVDRQMTILIPETVEQHWRVAGRACGAGMTLLIICRSIRDPERYGEPSYAKVLEWMTQCANDPQAGFSNLGSSWSGEATDIGGAQRPIQDVRAPANVDEGGDANPDLTAQLLDDAVKEAALHGYPARVMSELREVRMKPDRERGSVISTFAGSVSIFKNAAVASRTSTCSFRMPDVRGIGGKPVTIYVVIPLESAEFLGRVTGLLIESMAAFLLSQNDEEVKRTKQRPVFFLLDEFWTLPAVNAIRQVPSLGRGLWAVVLVVGQSWRQVASRFKGDGENVLSELKTSAPIKIIPTQNDEKTAEEVSKSIGNYTVEQKSVSRTMGIGKGVQPWMRNENASTTGLPLIRSDQVSSMEMFDPAKKKWGLQLVQLAGAMNRPLLLRPTVWFLDPKLRKRAALRNKHKDLMEVLYRPPVLDGKPAKPARPRRGWFGIAGAVALMLLPQLAERAQAADAAPRSGTVAAACPGHLDFRTWQVQPQLRDWRYAGDGTLILSDCRTDPTVPAIAMQRDSAGCTLLFEPERQRAREQSRVVYNDPQGREVEVLPCLPREGDRVFALRETYQGCPLDHHWEDRYSIALSRWAADVDGKTLASPCSDPHAGTVTLPHIQMPCDPLQGQRATYPQARIEINLPATGKRHVILGCRPVGTGLHLDTSGCRNVYFHDLVGRQSLGGQRLMAGSTPETECFPDAEAVYAHDEAVTGYRFNDRLRQATPLVKLVVLGTDVVVREPEPANWQLPYVLLGTRDVVVSETTVGCLAVPVIERWGDFQRPGGTTVSLYLGPGQAAKGGSCREGK